MKLIDIINSVTIPIAYNLDDCKKYTSFVDYRAANADGFYRHEMPGSLEFIYINESKIGHDVSQFYWVMIHELIHATGIRLNRFNTIKGLTKQEVANEELLACYCATEIMSLFGLKLSKELISEVYIQCIFFEKEFNGTLNKDNALKAIDFFLNNGLNINKNNKKVG